MRRNLVYIILAILVTTIGIEGAVLARIVKVKRLENKFDSSKQIYQRAVADGSLTGQVTEVGSTAEFEGRYDTGFRPLAVGETIGLGSDIRTGPDDLSMAKVTFGPLAEFKVGSNTRLNFTNTLPTNFLISLNRGGTIELITTADQGEVTITGLHLLTQFTSASAKMAIEASTITIELASGSVKLGYNDTDLQTQIQTVGGPKKIIFNDMTRTVKLKTL